MDFLSIPRSIQNQNSKEHSRAVSVIGERCNTAGGISTHSQPQGQGVCPSDASSEERWKKSRRRKLVDFLAKFVAFFRPRHEVARRFRGRIGWNGFEVNKEELLHSISFKGNTWLELTGFEMLAGDTSFRIGYTITKGQGVLGSLLSQGTGFVPRGNILHPSTIIRLTSSKRLEPDCWYCINVIVEIHEYEMVLITSTGCDGSSVVETESGVTIEYSNGLESCTKTNTRSGLIAGIVFHRIDPDEEAYLRSHPSSHTRRSSASVASQPPTNAANDTGELMDTPGSLTVTKKSTPLMVLPPLAGVITPPIRTEEVWKQIPSAPRMFNS